PAKLQSCEPQSRAHLDLLDGSTGIPSPPARSRISGKGVRGDARCSVPHGDTELPTHTDASLDKIDDLLPRQTDGCADAILDIQTDLGRCSAQSAACDLAQDKSWAGR